MAPKRHEYCLPTTNVVRLTIWLHSNVTKRRIGDDPTQSQQRRMDTQSTDAISTTQLSRAEYHAGSQCCIHSCYRPLLCLALESFTCNASRHSRQKGSTVTTTSYVPHKYKNYQVQLTYISIGICGNKGSEAPRVYFQRTSFF